MINVIPRWVDGHPKEFKPGTFIVYKGGDCELIGWLRVPSRIGQEILKHTTLIEPHELDWLQSMAVKRCLVELK